MTTNTIKPLDGEKTIPGLTPPPTNAGGRKRILAAGFMVLALIVTFSLVLPRYFAPKKNQNKEAEDVASAKLNPLNLATGPKPTTTPSEAPSFDQPKQASAEPIPLKSGGTRVPAIEGGGGSGAYSNASAGKPVKSVRPGDESPFVSGSAKPNAPGAAAQDRPHRVESEAERLLAEYMRKQLAPAAAPTTPDSTVEAAPKASAGLFGMTKSHTARVSARTLGDRNLVLPKGTMFMCALKTKVITAASGFVGCQVQRNVYSDNGRVLLVERGSHIDGEYNVVQVRPGTTRIPVLWTRVRTPTGVTVELDSPGTGELGESGIGGYVDNRWGERLGAALLLSLIEDAVKITVAKANDGGSGGTTVQLPGTADTGQKMAEMVLASTINIPPLIYANQGGVVGVYVSRDIDFSSVYRLEARQ
jgi:type IV secretion system protein VirB10